MSEKIVYPNIDSFDTEVMKSEKPVLVDFYADWCGPCQALAPTLEELADIYDGRVKICKINVDQNEKLAMAHRVMSIPTMLLVKDGEIKERLMGALPKQILEAKIGQLL